MSSMHTSPTTAESFAVVRRGFDREQVMGALTRLETETHVLRADRDAAVARAERATAEADRERSRVAQLEARVAELGRAPVTSDQMSDRVSTMLSLATAEAESIRDSALATADRIRAEAEEEAPEVEADEATDAEAEAKDADADADADAEADADADAEKADEKYVDLVDPSLNESARLITELTNSLGITKESIAELFN